MAEHPDYFDRLYPFQDRLIRILSGLDTGLYLTGGTAASRGYLQHRFSEDLAFFADDAHDFPLWCDRLMKALRASPLGRLEVLQREERICRLELLGEEVNLKVELVNDVPSRVGEVVQHPALGRLDNPENILANKVTALIDRDEPKDLADVWGFCLLKGLSLREALKGAEGKAAGVFPPDLARRLLSATIEDWRVIRWIKAPDSRRFLDELHGLGEDLLRL